MEFSNRLVRNMISVCRQNKEVMMIRTFGTLKITLISFYEILIRGSKHTSKTHIQSIPVDRDELSSKAASPIP